ncbi:MAG: hypothetical protein KJ630_10910 [Proteobacteria bacterium]|nr:hypothetical protein [Pseudomonadota bacterium]
MGSTVLPDKHGETAADAANSPDEEAFLGNASKTVEFWQRHSYLPGRCAGVARVITISNLGKRDKYRKEIRLQKIRNEILWHK